MHITTKILVGATVVSITLGLVVAASSHPAGPGSQSTAMLTAFSVLNPGGSQRVSAAAGSGIQPKHHPTERVCPDNGKLRACFAIRQTDTVQPE